MYFSYGMPRASEGGFLSHSSAKLMGVLLTPRKLSRIPMNSSVKACCLASAYRLYEDELDSFVFGVIPEDVRNPKKYCALLPGSTNGLWKKIPVPSRLYAKTSTEKPLAGARMGIKDIFRLEGTQLIMMSRPWVELYGPDTESAPYTKKLIGLGAVIVGKTKMTSFASPEEPTDQWG